MNHKHLANNLGIATDGFSPSEVSNILNWLEEKKVLTLDGLKIKEEFENKFVNVSGGDE